MTPQEIEALTATRQVDHPRLLRMQLQPEPGQHQAHPLSRRLDRRLRVAHDHEVVGVTHQRPQVRPPVLPDPVEDMQVDVRQQRRDDAPLRSPRKSPLHLPVVQHGDVPDAVELR